MKTYLEEYTIVVVHSWWCNTQLYRLSFTCCCYCLLSSESSVTNNQPHGLLLLVLLLHGTERSYNIKRKWKWQLKAIKRYFYELLHFIVNSFFTPFPFWSTVKPFSIRPMYRAIHVDLCAVGFCFWRPAQMQACMCCIPVFLVFFSVSKCWT